MSQVSSPPFFFIDRCFGKHPIQEFLREMGVQVGIHDDHCPLEPKNTAVSLSRRHS